MPRRTTTLAIAFGVVLMAAIAVVILTALGDLERVDEAQASRGHLIAHVVAGAVARTAQYGPDAKGRVALLLEGVAESPGVVGLSLSGEGEDGAKLGAKLPPELVLDELSSGVSRMGDYLVVVHQVEVPAHKGKGKGPGKGMGKQRNELPPGPYRLVVALQQGTTDDVRQSIVLQSVALGGLLLLLVVATILLMRGVAVRGRLERRISLERARRESLESLRLLAAGLAHELKNPLGAVRGHAQLLLEGAEGSEAEGTFEIILDEVDKATERLEEFLTFARRRRQRDDTVDMAEVVAHVAELVGPEATMAGVELRWQVPERPLEAKGDGAQLTELVLNLTLNAIQACSEGDEVELVGRHTDEGVRLTVRDSGSGMTDEVLGRVFEPYYTTKRGGTGLGLAIARRIAEDHDGTLTLASTPDEGTVATFCLMEGVTRGDPRSGMRSDDEQEAR